jgi:hypothetical protein
MIWLVISANLQLLAWEQGGCMLAAAVSPEQRESWRSSREPITTMSSCQEKQRGTLFLACQILTCRSKCVQQAQAAHEAMDPAVIQ